MDDVCWHKVDVQFLPLSLLEKTGDVFPHGNPVPDNLFCLHIFMMFTDVLSS